MVRTFTTIDEIAEELASILMGLIDEEHYKPVHIALSGGSTPNLIYKYLAKNYGTRLADRRYHYWWGDERCVSPRNQESNYRWARQYLLKPIGVHESNIHRLKGEFPYQQEEVRYADEISKAVEKENGWPCFDLIILGIGSDGHTASIFPHQMVGLLRSEHICECSVHPLTRQRRITLTGKVLNNARKLVFIVTGEGKAPIIKSVIKNANPIFPATHIKPHKGEVIWLLDNEAAKLL